MFWHISDIAPGRKAGSRTKIPMEKLYDEYQIGMWYDEGVRAGFLNQLETGTFESEKIHRHSFIKYRASFSHWDTKVDLSGQWDNQTKLVVQSFQYHFLAAIRRRSSGYGNLCYFIGIIAKKVSVKIMD